MEKASGRQTIIQKVEAVIRRHGTSHSTYCTVALIRATVAFLLIRHRRQGASCTYSTRSGKQTSKCLRLFCNSSDIVKLYRRRWRCRRKKPLLALWYKTARFNLKRTRKKMMKIGSRFFLVKRDHDQFVWPSVFGVNLARVNSQSWQWSTVVGVWWWWAAWIEKVLGWWFLDGTKNDCENTKILMMPILWKLGRRGAFQH